MYVQDYVYTTMDTTVYTRQHVQDYTTMYTH